MSYRILVTGSRDWTNRDVLASVLMGEWYRSQHAAPVLVHGACEGVDLMAAEIWKRYGLPTDPHPAPWEQYGKRAGYVRNADMVALGANVCVAFLMPCSKAGCTRGSVGHLSHGTSMCADLAEKAGIQVVRIRG